MESVFEFQPPFEKEQEAVIAAYAALLNSLSFSVQIVVRTIRKDISSYLNYLDESAKKIANPGLYKLMLSYRRFILDSIKKKNVLGKRFYLVLPFSRWSWELLSPFLP